MRAFGEPGGCEDLDELCFQQSAGDSTGPEVDVAQRLSGRTSPMMMSAICTRPPGLRTRAISAIARSFSGHEVEDTVRNHDIDALILGRQPSRVARSRRPRSPRPQAAAPAARSRIASVMSTPMALTGRTDLARRQQQVSPGATADVEHRGPGRNPPQRVGIADPGK